MDSPSAPRLKLSQNVSKLLSAEVGAGQEARRWCREALPGGQHPAVHCQVRPKHLSSLRKEVPKGADGIHERRGSAPGRAGDLSRQGLSES